jgi:hypothetical protein
MKPTYTKLAADGSDLPADSTEKHLAVRVDHPLLKPADRRRLPLRQVRLEERREEGRSARRVRLAVAPATVEELFLVTDRTDPSTRCRQEFFPDAEDYEWTWSSTVDAESPSGFAWGVSLGYGYSYRYYQSDHGGVRAVRAGQF